MSVDKDQLKRNKPGATMDENTSGVVHQAGLWRHPESGAEEITLEDPLYGNAQSEAFARTGFVRVGDAPEGAIKTMPQASIDAEQAKLRTNASASDMKGVQARLDALEGVAEENARLKAENEALKASQPTDTSTPEATVDGKPEDELPLDKQNRAQLEDTATAEGLTDLEKYDTKAKLAEAITAKREGK